MTNGYTKLFSTIVTSTIWSEGKDAKILWITMLALSNADGIVEASVPGLANAARLTPDECRNALAILEGPDPDSRTTEFDGRRVEHVEGGWLILNYLKYKEKMSRAERLSYFARKQSEYRERKKQLTPTVPKQHTTHAERIATEPKDQP